MKNQLERIKSKLLERLQKYLDDGYLEDGEYLLDDKIKSTLQPYLDDEIIGKIKFQPLPIEKLIAFENEYHIKLPKELVEFYTKISNGAMLYPDEGICNLEPFENWYFSPKNIQKEFNIENDMTYDDYEALETRNYSFENFGNIEIMDLGCGMSCCIVVKGKHCGEIIALHEMWLEITNKNFLDWLEGCLDGTDENML